MVHLLLKPLLTAWGIRAEKPPYDLCQNGSRERLIVSFAGISPTSPARRRFAQTGKDASWISHVVDHRSALFVKAVFINL